MEIFDVLKKRFEANMHRHAGITWQMVQDRLMQLPEAKRVLVQMEATGGEPDVVGVDKQTAEIIFFDCSTETPAGRRSLCYDDAALAARKEFKPVSSACAMATQMGVNLLSEAEYHYLQSLTEVDKKTSSWLQTPEEIRKQGGALFGDRRYGRVFIYHNGASSYYAVRGFRASFRV